MSLLERLSLHGARAIRHWILTSVIVLGLSFGPGSRADALVGTISPHYGFVADARVCSAFQSYFAHQALKTPNKNIFVGNSDVLFIDEEPEPWAGVDSIKSLPPDDENNKDANSLGYTILGHDDILFGDYATGEHREYASQLFWTDYFDNHGLRLTLITTNGAALKFRRSQAVILKPGVSLKVIDLHDEYDPDMIIHGPNPEDVDAIIGSYFDTFEAQTLKNVTYTSGARRTLKESELENFINELNGQQPRKVQFEHLTHYYYFWNDRVPQPYIRPIYKEPMDGHAERMVDFDYSDISYQGAIAKDNHDAIENWSKVRAIVWPPSFQKAYQFDGRVFFAAEGGVIYRLSDKWKIEVLCN